MPRDQEEQRKGKTDLIDLFQELQGSQNLEISTEKCFSNLFFYGSTCAVWKLPRLGVKSSELQLPAYTTATAMPDQSCVCDLHYSLQQLDPQPTERGQVSNPHLHGY